MLRKPLTDDERQDAKDVWEMLLRTNVATIYDITIALAVDQRYARRLLAGLGDHYLVQYSQPRNLTGYRNEAHRRIYEARRDPHAQRGYEDLFGEPMPEEARL